jgi:hypothetical protein
MPSAMSTRHQLQIPVHGGGRERAEKERKRRRTEVNAERRSVGARTSSSSDHGSDDFGNGSEGDASEEEEGDGAEDICCTERSQLRRGERRRVMRTCLDEPGVDGAV